MLNKAKLGSGWQNSYTERLALLVNGVKIQPDLATLNAIANVLKVDVKDLIISNKD